MSKTPYRYFPVIAPTYRAIRRIIRLRQYAGDEVYCLCCKRFFSGWVGRKSDGYCPNCSSTTRQKILVHFLEQYALAKPGPFRTLYFAPDPGPLEWFRSQEQFQLTTTDLSAPGVDVHWDITNIPEADGTYDVIACSHVLEHVPEDRAAMAELRRLLKDDGILYLQVPYAREMAKTDEDPTLTDPLERERRFGQFDHVRCYGQDLLDRLTESGFSVESTSVEDVFTPEDMKRLGLWNDILFTCRPNLIS